MNDETLELPLEEPATELNPIITFLDQARWPILEAPSQPCSIPINETDAAMIAKMSDILDALDDNALGLAAVQIGYPKQIFLLRGFESQYQNSVYINPTVLTVSKEMKKDTEACLSLPGIGGFFKRPKSITIQYYDHEHNLKITTFNGLFARAVLHEIGHLNGELITRHMNNVKQSSKTKFGMNLSKEKVSLIKDRREKAKKAKRARKLNRG